VGVIVSTAVSLSRAERKAQTRERILAAVWTLVESGRGLDSLGLREVARTARLAAPSLYNHFSDMESLGLALLDQACFRLRQRMSEGRRQLMQDSTPIAITTLVQRFLDYLDQHGGEFRLLVQQRTGSNPVFRRRIHHELQLAIAELQEDIRLVLPDRSEAAGARMEAEVIAAILLGFGIQALDIDKSVRERQAKRLSTQLEMVALGAKLAAKTNK
jgi:AcrR family transcriptional regulator